MSGFKDDETYTTFVYPFGAKFVRKVKDGDTPGAISRENKNGDIIFEVPLSSQFEGTLKDIRIQKGDFGHQLMVAVIDDELNSYIITFPANSAKARTIMNRVGNLNFIEPFGMRLFEGSYIDEKTKKEIITFNVGVFQGRGDDGKKTYVPEHISKEEVPKPVPVTTDQGTIYNRSAQIDWYNEYLENKVRPLLAVASPSVQAQTVQPKENGLKDEKQPETPQIPGLEGSDDLPF